MTENNDKLPEHDSRMHKRHRQEIVAVCILTVVTIGVMLTVGIVPRMSRNVSLAQGVKEARSHVPEVVVIKPHYAADTGMVLPGNIEAINQTTVNARSTGYLKRLYVDIGSKVTAGQLLAEIGAPDMDQQAAQAAAQAEQARALARQSAVDVKRQSIGVAQSQAEVARQQATLEQARAQVTSAEAAATQAEVAEQGAESQLTHAMHQHDVQQAVVSQQKAQLDLAEVTYKRYKALVDQGFETQQDLDQSLAALKTAQAQQASAQASLKAAQADVVSAQKQVSASRAAINAAHANVEAAKRNVQANMAALKSIEAGEQFARETVSVSRAGLEANKAAVNSSIANASRFRTMQGFERIVAPFDGVITARNVDLGALVIADTNPASSGTSATISNSSTSIAGSGLLAIARTDEVRIQVSIPQAFVPSLNAGSTASVTVRELPGREYSGTISLRSGAIDTVSRTQMVEVHLPNKDHALVPGMYAEVQVTPANPPRSLRVPGTALIVDASGTRVGVVTKDNKVKMRPVVVGRDFGREVEVLSGLKGREQIVNNPSDLLQDGDTVVISKIQPVQTGRGAAEETGGDARGGTRTGKRRGGGKSGMATGAEPPDVRSRDASGGADGGNGKSEDVPHSKKPNVGAAPMSGAANAGEPTQPTGDGAPGGKRRGHSKAGSP